MVPLCSTLSFSQNASGAACAFYAGRSCWSVAIDWGITPVGGGDSLQLGVCIFRARVYGPPKAL